jgi:enoyl-CoA hydratase/carnithine racemase
VSDAIAKRDRDLGNFIPGPSLDSYRTRFAEHFALDRRDSVLTVRAHRDGQAALWSRGLLNAWNLLLGIVNEVLPRGDLLPRALDLASQIMASPRTARRLTHGLITRTWQRPLVAGLRDSYAHQLLAMATRPARPSEDSRTPDRRE